METLRPVLRKIFFGDSAEKEHLIVPIQGNWFQPKMEQQDTGLTYVGYQILQHIPKSTAKEEPISNKEWEMHFGSDSIIWKKGTQITPADVLAASASRKPLAPVKPPPAPDGEAQRYNVSTVVRLIFYGPQAEQMAISTTLWDARDDVKKYFEEVKGKLNYLERRVWSAPLRQEGFNDSLLWVTDIRIANFVETGGEK
jgi:hypothetical protein